MSDDLPGIKARTTVRPEEVIEVSDHAYILASSALADEHTRVLKNGETFAVFDRHGDIAPLGRGEQGLYHDGTRFLSRSSMRIAGQRPLLLSSTVHESNMIVTVDMTNPDIHRDGEVMLTRGHVHVFRSQFLWDATCHERIRVTNHGRSAISLSLSLSFDADYADLFEVRGMKRAQHGQRLETVFGQGQVVFGYQGLDGAVRRTRLRFDPSEVSLSARTASYTLELGPGQERHLDLAIDCEYEPIRRSGVGWRAAYQAAEQARQVATASFCRIAASNEPFNAWVRRSESDLLMMTTQTEHGLYPYAGVPWYSTAFGRDGIITAMQTLWAAPSLARGVLTWLAANQAHEHDDTRDAEPGKILHETRRGEMAALGEIPFGRYYGTIDATPLFVMLMGEYHRHTGDRSLVETLWPAVEAALTWMERHGDLDGDGFLEYGRRAAHGLVNQGWKDSDDCIFHADGTLAEGPIALCEVQGYQYAALRSAAALARALGDATRANELEARALSLREHFEEAFWCEELGTYALALDGQKRRCRVRASNAGHLLMTGIAQPARARRLAADLTREPFFSGWGIRTVAAGEARYNPMSYHNGSVWPHDNALAALGMARLGLKDEAMQVMHGLFDASIALELHRLPELFCGFSRRPGEGPTLYPVACSPQAWASGVVHMLIGACLGLEVDGLACAVRLDRPVLPPFIEQLRIEELRVGAGSVDLELRRQPYDVGVHVLRRSGSVEVTIVK